MDGDGVHDIAASQTFQGRVTVYSGADGSLLHDIVGPGITFGQGLSISGDLDGDGRADLAIGIPRYGSYNGGVQVIRGSDGRTLLRREGSHGEYGHGLEICDDVDGDGIDDLVVGSPELTNYGEGRIDFLAFPAVADPRRPRVAAVRRRRGEPWRSTSRPTRPAPNTACWPRTPAPVRVISAT